MTTLNKKVYKVVVIYTTQRRAYKDKPQQVQKGEGLVSKEEMTREMG